ncbi:uncharacterized protein MONOS_6536 [Monocercomonoides exilis]|uniref:uncharacterized protein n=1 Tax=Monocercomonoides exilis TaxID=2049356 RepID=UPI00355A0444|nr:hypothetical protein MONOS_6536 [Monocercomonoides exilis]|eukprot:MONOS_6536.1-p1 / transcript=MONOS_6536.1 / gene=MONOS_6536 / organism=Monocercomonoides_exilis_PA203 / gene_product=unspecified product / transcript_product=unspecified product / location=Mono_scaffold00207:45698-46301(+) / protein_length=183 / sequence_SO=supercontig / SO=protein_coding / is_pseudo=false
MLCHQIDDLTKQVDNERAMSNPYSSQKLHDSLKEQIRKQCLKNKAASKSASSLSLDEHISELQKQKEDLIVELSQLKVDEDRNLHSSFEQGRMDIEEGSETSGEFIGNLGMENGSFANQEVEMDIEDSHESALQSDSKTEKTYDQLLDAKIILAGELEELKHKIDDLKRTECSECERRMLEE